MNPEKAIEIVKAMRPDGHPNEPAEIKMLVDIRDQILRKVEMLEYEVKGINRAIEILRS